MKGLFHNVGGYTDGGICAQHMVHGGNRFLSLKSRFFDNDIGCILGLRERHRRIRGKCWCRCCHVMRDIVPLFLRFRLHPERGLDRQSFFIPGVHGEDDPA